MSEVIKFEFNIPVEVALRFTEPRVFPSQFDGGDDRHMFSTTDGRVMYVTPLTSARINALRVSKGECFWICKRKNGRLTEFAVSREPMSVNPAPPPAAPRPPAPFKTKLPESLYAHATAQEPAPGPSLEDQLRASIDMVQRRKATVGEQGDGTLAIMAPPADVKMYGTSSHPRPAAAERLAPAVAEFSARLVLETTALVDVFAQALQHASRHGMAIKPDDVRSILISAYINQCQKGRNNAA